MYNYTYTIGAYPSLPPQFNDLLQCIKEKYSSLSVEVHSDEMAHWAIVHGKMTTLAPINTPIHNPRMIVHTPHDTSDMKFTFEANFMTIFSGSTTDDSFDNLMQSMLSDSGYYVCPGVPHDIFEKCSFETKNARKWMSPFNRIDHKECEQWFKLPPKARQKRKHAPTCNKCVRLRHYLLTEVKRRAAVTPTQIEKRALPTSKCPIKYLAPSTRRMRLALLIKRQHRNSMQRKVHHCKKYDLDDIGTATHNHEPGAHEGQIANTVSR